VKQWKNFTLMHNLDRIPMFVSFFDPSILLGRHMLAFP